MGSLHLAWPDSLRRAVTKFSQPRRSSQYLEAMLGRAHWHRVRVGLVLSLILIFAGMVVDSIFSASWALDDGLLLAAAAIVALALLRIRGRGQA
jgi:hypothetical protein